MCHHFMGDQVTWLATLRIRPCRVPGSLETSGAISEIDSVREGCFTECNAIAPAELDAESFLFFIALDDDPALSYSSFTCKR